MSLVIRIPVTAWWFPLAGLGWGLVLYGLPLVLGLALSRLPGRGGGQPGPRGRPRSWPGGTTGGRGLAAGFFTYLLLSNWLATLGLGLEGPGWGRGLWLQAAFLAAFLIPAYAGWLRPGGQMGRRVGWTWAAALGLDGAAGAWVVRAALEAGGLAAAPAAALAAARLLLAWGLGLLLADGRRPPRRQLLAGGVVAGLPPLLTAVLPAGAGLVAWSLVLRAAAAGLVLSGLAGGRLVPGARRLRGEAQWAFALAMAAAMAAMFLLAQWMALPLGPGGAVLP
ncbi:hypothetical protein [Thermaerobacter subterraneus]|uniref:hypothetical protein n=1 Tax=Thermaerobacter subterraneus TaxID=175696 RepID=UPI001FA741AC|nr:hypothetical protein [Thermaerobacter subterraneus]